ncbi:hypothetical protein [Hydrogenimonas sp. SS33]|uniref:hypothetical protein n=1 Tax=Hydrogenimonas leucolamina TaxID=2954236 RepID=UPI00336BF690
MSLRKRIVSLLFVWAALYLVVSHIPRQPVQWASFFTAGTGQKERTDWFAPGRQYLLVCDASPARLEEARKKGALLGYYRLPANDGETLYLLLFERKHQNEILRIFGSLPHAGTLVASEIFRTGFDAALQRYLLFVLPLLAGVALLFISVRYWLAIWLELSGYLLASVLFLWLLQIPVDAVAVLAWLFLSIYATTLLNYLHLGEIERRKLALGIGVSIATTLVSTLYLSFSDFGLMHTFGLHASAGLVILGLYLAVLLRFARHRTVRSQWIERFYRKWTQRGVVRGVALLYLTAAAMLAAGHSRLAVDLNPFNLLSKESGLRQQIAAFERRCSPALPFVVAVHTTQKGQSFEDLATTRKAEALLARIERAVPAAKPFVTTGTLFERFADRPLKEATPAAFAQFLLALEWSEAPPLLSPDARTLYATFTVSLLTPSHLLDRIVRTVHTYRDDSKSFRLEVMGKVADFETMVDRFVREGLYGFLFSFLFVALFFLRYCKTWRIVPVIVVSALFPLVMFLGWHLLTGRPLTLVSMIALILYAGLYADGFIHIFICYARQRSACIPTVLKPIVASNLTMLAALAGMLFCGSLLGAFGLEMTVILFFNLLGISLLLPRLLGRWAGSCTV